MNWIQKRQASLSCIAALFGIAVLALGASWINSFVYEALGEAQPVRILTTLLLIASLVWLADITVDEEGSQSRSIAWFLLSLLLFDLGVLRLEEQDDTNARRLALCHSLWCDRRDIYISSFYWSKTFRNCADDTRRRAR